MFAIISNIDITNMPILNGNFKSLVTSFLKIFMCLVTLFGVSLIVFTLYTYVNMKKPVELPKEVFESESIASESEVVYELYEKQSVNEGKAKEIASSFDVPLLLTLKDNLDSYASTGVMSSIKDPSGVVEKVFEVKEVLETSSEVIVVELYPNFNSSVPYKLLLDCNVDGYRTINEPGEFTKCLVDANAASSRLLVSCARPGLIVAYICSSPHCFGGTKDCYFYEKK